MFYRNNFERLIFVYFTSVPKFSTKFWPESFYFQIVSSPDFFDILTVASLRLGKNHKTLSVRTLFIVRLLISRLINI